MPDVDIATAEAKAIGRKLMDVLGEAVVEKAARRCGFLRRRRDIGPAALRPLAGTTPHAALKLRWGSEGPSSICAACGNGPTPHRRSR